MFFWRKWLPLWWNNIYHLINCHWCIIKSNDTSQVVSLKSLKTEMIDERTYLEIHKKGTSLLQQSADQSPAIWGLEEVVHREIDSVKWNTVAKTELRKRRKVGTNTCARTQIGLIIWLWGLMIRWPASLMCNNICSEVSPSLAPLAPDNHPSLSKRKHHTHRTYVTHTSVWQKNKKKRKHYLVNLVPHLSLS